MDIRATIKLFMDSKAVTAAVDRGELTFLKRWGAFTRTVARRSMRKRKKPSAPGQPPRVDSGLLKRFVFFAFDPVNRAMIVGPAELSGAIRRLGIPRILEEGGDSPSGPLHEGETAYVERRPYMNPAKAEADRRIPQFMKDTVK